MRPKDRELAEQLEARLVSFDRSVRALRGIRDPGRRLVFLEQLIESVRRVKYVSVMRQRPLSERRADPTDEFFDPVKAAILQQREGCVDEAFWLVFLAVHFGKHPRAGWRYARDIYGRLGNSAAWDWQNISADPRAFRQWLDANKPKLKRLGANRGGFGNHRKYQSLDAYSDTGTGAAVESYVKWVAPPRTHEQLMQSALENVNGDPYEAFDHLFESMECIASFGRTARFDYLTMVGSLQLAPIEPGSTYVQGSTGPLEGARLLFGGKRTAAISPGNLDDWLIQLAAQLHVGMQVLEDALCNWQKSPGKFLPFRG